MPLCFCVYGRSAPNVRLPKATAEPNFMDHKPDYRMLAQEVLRKFVQLIRQEYLPWPRASPAY